MTWTTAVTARTRRCFRVGPIGRADRRRRQRDPAPELAAIERSVAAAMGDRTAAGTSAVGPSDARPAARSRIASGDESLEPTPSSRRTGARSKMPSFDRRNPLTVRSLRMLTSYTIHQPAFIAKLRTPGGVLSPMAAATDLSIAASSGASRCRRRRSARPMAPDPKQRRVRAGHRVVHVIGLAVCRTGRYGRAGRFGRGPILLQCGSRPRRRSRSRWHRRPAGLVVLSVAAGPRIESSFHWR